MAIISVVESALPGADIFKGTPVNFGVPYVALTTGFQIIVTGLISGRLLMMYKQVRSVLSSESAKTYTSVVAILVESATPFAITGVAYLIAYQSGSPTTFAFAQVWSIFSVCLSFPLRPAFLLNLRASRPFRLNSSFYESQWAGRGPRRLSVWLRLPVPLEAVGATPMHLTLLVVTFTPPRGLRGVRQMLTLGLPKSHITV